MTNYKALARKESRSKAELLEALDKLQEKLDAKPTLSPIQKKQAAEKKASVKEATGGLTVETVSQQAVSLGIDLSKALQTVADRASEFVSKLENVQEAVNYKQAELEELYGKEVALQATDQLLTAFQEERQTFETEMAEQRSAWAAEKEANALAVAAEEQAQAESRQKADDEYAYSLKRRRQASEDEFADQVRAQKRKEAERQAELKAQWDAERAEIQADRTQLAEDRDAFEAERESFTKKAEQSKNIAVSAVKKEYDHQIALMTKESEAAANLAQATIDNVTAQLTAEKADNQQLRTRLAEAEKRVETIANNAISGAGAQQALNEMKSFVASQSNGKHGK